VAPQRHQRDLDLDDATVHMDIMDVGDSESMEAKDSESEQDIHLSSSPLTEQNGKCINLDLP
jgi:hypothetical protein